MKTHLCILSLAVLASTVVQAGSFRLLDHSAEQIYGPFEYEDNATIKIGDSLMTLKIVTRDETAAERLAKSIVIPSLEFRNAALSDVLEYLREASISGINEPNVNLILNVKNPRAPVTLRLRQVNLAMALEYISQMNDLNLRWDDNAAVITDKEKEVEHVH
jgi:hypothetical protein